MNDKVLIVVPWHTDEVRGAFLDAWGITGKEDELILQHDADREGCAKTKNRGIGRALVRGADVIVVLDSDCFPAAPLTGESGGLSQLIEALQPQDVAMLEEVTYPPSRGTPYFDINKTMKMPVAASMGFWEENGDHCAVRQLATQNGTMSFTRE